MTGSARCFIALGSNLGRPLEQVTDALMSLAAEPGCELIEHSSWYRSAPMGPPGQPD